jgi:hypothetical protein
VKANKPQPTDDRQGNLHDLERHAPSAESDVPRISRHVAFGIRQCLQVMIIQVPLERGHSPRRVLGPYDDFVL